MDRAEFIHLVRLSEHDSADDPRAYRRSVARFAALGYAWVVGCLLLAVALLAWLAAQWLEGARFHGYWVLLGLFAAGLLWSSLRALRVPMEPPAGLPLARTDAPTLFDALERIRRKIKGPAIDHVLLTDDFNAAIVQLPRFGLLGGSTNYLALGLPLMMAVDRRRLLAVLAHEYGHLRGGHGRFSAWVYRSRMAWGRLWQDMQQRADIVSALSRSFFAWYFPRFHARSFAMARQDEYEADRIARKLLGADAISAALMEIEIKGAWLARSFWTTHWRQARDTAVPRGPYSAMARALALEPDAAFAHDSLRAALRRMSGDDDTHPVLRDRLEALQPDVTRFSPPLWSARPALRLLKDPVRWTQHFDTAWRRDHAGAWKLQHAWFSRLRERVAALTESLGRNNAQEMVELADLARRLDPQAPARAWYERALALSPDLPAALRGLADCTPPARRAERLELLQRLFDANAAYRWWASREAVALLEQPMDDEAALRRWRERLRAAEVAEERAQAELRDQPALGGLMRPDLSDFERGELQAELRLWPAVATAWVASKPLKEFPWRRCYLLVVESPRLPPADLLELCGALEAALPLPGPVLAVSTAHGVHLAHPPSALERVK
ncbi:M48 family metallopeptidase [Ramlibacter sp. H39-3-26]|uniref:M48 family metallopeptidase n=1 Tax=Curvibacter soli TaxID=3031331 RepID=UPI0023DC7502|nr:M48 family metallopeptidase [Ramlibacter sp. H39-3-26]MDF1484478.1 M48 family metallopeptidase [Ramlibacter sp. H39-3-26]